MNIVEQYSVLKKAKCGFEFEFFTNLDKEEAREKLALFLKKAVIVPYTVSGHNEKVVKAHSEFAPSADIFKLEVDGSGGKKMVELVTGALPYDEARLLLLKTLEWISQNGWTNDRCGLHLNLSFPPKDVKSKYKISEINTLKFCLGFNEEFLLSRFPDRRNNVYAKSIKEILHANPFVRNFQNEFDARNYITPTSKYYGVNFSKMQKGYLEFRYLGGKEYEKKGEQILEIIEHCLLYMYSLMQENNLNDEEKIKLRIVNQKVDAILRVINKYEHFKHQYPLFKVTIDLLDNVEIVKTHWNNLIPIIYNLVYVNDVQIGELNYDAETGKVQVREMAFKNAKHLEFYELIDCEISGSLTDCALYACKGKNVTFTSCTFHHDNSFKSGKIMNCLFASDSNSFEDFWIANGSYPLYGEIKNSIVRDTSFYPNFDKIDNEFLPQDYEVK